jgi:hypothetical protein
MDQRAISIFKSDKGMEIHKPNTDGVSRFLPIARPYPAEILQLVPELLPEATALAETSDALGVPFREQLLKAATELCDAKGLAREIVDTDRDLANATRNIPQPYRFITGNGCDLRSVWSKSDPSHHV